MGKTYAAWLGPLLLGPGRRRGRAPAAHGALDHAAARARRATPASRSRAPPRRCKPHWTVDVRTGDTPASARARQDRAAAHRARHHAREPDAAAVARRLARALRAPRGRRRRRMARAPRRASAACRSSSRWRGCAALRPALPRVGTVGDARQLDEALACAARPARAAQARIVRGLDAKTIAIDTLRPPTIERFPWAGHIGVKLLPEVVARDRARALDARLHQRALAPPRSGTRRSSRRGPTGRARIALHHGSLERDVRDWVEDGLRDGALRAVVCTSSLDLGVDFAPVDQVLQIGSPKGVARLLQRAGRSGHRPGEVSRVTVVPTHALELVEAAAAREAAPSATHRAAHAGATRRSTCSSQHLVTCALGGGFVPDGAAATRCAARTPTRDLTRRRVAMGARLRRARRREPQRLSRVPARRDRRRRRRARARRADRAPPSHADRHDRQRREHHRAVAQRQRKLGHVEESFIARLRRATASCSPAACSSSCACAR